MSVDGPHNGGAQLRSPVFGTHGWWIYQGTGRPLRDITLAELLPTPPPWRDFRGGPLPERDAPPPDDGEIARRLGGASPVERRADADEADMVNAALYLRRPLLVTGRPGTGKSSLAFRISRELGLGRVLRWPITSRTTLKDGLYHYDAIGRVQAAAAEQAVAHRLTDEGVEPPAVGDFVRLGPLGTAFLPATLPRVLLIDELDKSEVDLPNDLLSVFEDGRFVIPELERMRERAPEASVRTDDPDRTARVVDGRIICRAFPVIVITSNGERDFPEAFLRRCLRLDMKDPDAEQLAAMVAAHLTDTDDEQQQEMIQEFLDRSAETGGLPADKLLDAVYLATSGAHRADDASWRRLREALWRRMTSAR